MAEPRSDAGLLLRVGLVPVRIAVWWLALGVVVAPFVSGGGIVGVVGGVAAGVVLGEVAAAFAVTGRRIGAAVAGAVAVGMLSAWTLTSTGLAGLLGPSVSLQVADLLSYGLGSFALVGGLRALGAQRGGWRSVEAAALAGGVVALTAPHRDGVMVRPLWLSDAAWRAGVPVEVALLLLGALAASVGLLLLLAESPAHRREGGIAVVLLGVVLGAGLADRLARQPPAEAEALQAIQGEPGEGAAASAGVGDPVGRGQPGEGAEPRAGGGSDDGAGRDDAGAGRDDAGAGREHDGVGREDDGVGRDDAGAGRDDAGVGRDDAGVGRDQDPRGTTEPRQGTTEPRQGTTEPRQGAPEDGPVDPATRGTPSAEGAGQDARPEAGDGAASAAPDEGGTPDDRQGPAGGPRDPARSEGDPGGDPKEGDAGQPPPKDSDANEPPPKDRDANEPPPKDSDANEPPDTDAPPPEPPDLDEDRGPASNRSEPVAVVLLGDDLTPPEEVFYLRQEVLSWLDGARLVPSPPDAGLDDDVLRELPVVDTVAPEVPPDEGRVLVHGDVAVLVSHPGPFGLTAPVAYAPRRNPDPTRFVASWSFRSLAPVLDWEQLRGRTAGRSDWPDEVWAAYTALPADARYRRLADSLVGDLSDALQADPFANALAFKRHLDLNMTYDTAARHAGVADPTADFLFGDLRGYCTHTAHALVYLLRARGVPARVATGYAIPASERRGSTLLVRGHQAHAWAELYLDGLGWVSVDVSPTKVASTPPPPLDEDVARQLGEMARQAPSEVPVRSTLDDVFSRIVGWLRGAAPVALRVLLAVAGAGLVGALVAKRWRLWRPVWSASADLPVVSYVATLERLASVGLGRTFGESREAHAARVALTAPSFPALTALHLAASFRRDGAGDGDPRAAERAVAAEIRQHIPWWRRALGAVDLRTLWRAL